VHIFPASQIHQTLLKELSRKSLIGSSDGTTLLLSLQPSSKLERRIVVITRSTTNAADAILRQRHQIWTTSTSAPQIAKASLLHQSARQGGILRLHLPMPILAGQPILPLHLLLQPAGQDFIGILSLVGLSRSRGRGGGSDGVAERQVIVRQRLDFVGNLLLGVLTGAAAAEMAITATIATAVAMRGTVSSMTAAQRSSRRLPIIIVAIAAVAIFQMDPRIEFYLITARHLAIFLLNM
jgi:hypothetical protein